tara:strand:- start:146 stop:328 length:183 start_codon:yes stop_codon:yes gene_type:complete
MISRGINMYDKERDMNPPEPRDNYEPDVDRDNDDMWLRKKEEEERQQEIVEACCQLGDVK